MARTAMTVYVITRDGLDESTATPVACDVANGNTIPNRGFMFIKVHNTNAGSTSHDLTIHLPGGTDGQGILPKTKTIAAGQTKTYGPWLASAYGGNLLINGAHAELTITPYELQQG